jgi:segregation and condensation protein B
MQDTEEVKPQEETATPDAAEALAVEDTPVVVEAMTAEEVLSTGEVDAAPPAVVEAERAQMKAIIEAVCYITDEPLTQQQIAAALQRPMDVVKGLLDELVADYARPERGLMIREVAGGFKMATKPEHHESIRTFVKNLKPPLKLSLAALETLAVIAYKQPITAPEIMEIRGVAGAGVLKTLLDRKLIATAGRKNVVGKPILYKTTKEFLLQFGLKDMTELPTLKEFEELGRLAIHEPEPPTNIYEESKAIAAASEAGKKEEAGKDSGGGA